MSDLVKQTFILRAVNEYFQRTSSQMADAARKLKIGVTDEGIKSITYEAAIQGTGVTGSLSFKEYLRMVDMGAGKSHPIGGLKAVSVALQTKNNVGIKLVKDKTRKPKKFYSKTAYGNLSYMIGKISSGYSEEVINQIKTELEQKK